ncbi:MAG: thioredoxin [Isosphaeraceae bacterium]
MAGKAVEITDSSFSSEVLSSSIPVLVDFWATWCPPCRRLAPTIEKLANDFEGRVKVGKMDTDQNNDTPSSLRISSLPTVVLFQNGKEVDRIVGYVEESKFLDSLARIGVQ